MKVKLHSEQPDQPLRPQLKDLVRDATHVDLAVAFVTESGTDAIHAIINQLNGKELKGRTLNVNEARPRTEGRGGGGRGFEGGGRRGGGSQS